eukprot:TRINITY_DN8439_c1_g1_i1.p1 TRINITY_DN8439_c1_g1~~TRINITY_DN8439_c1_g1_i1.p1  ORF type:complete len:504 (-),score=77.49 TRINITY_DN8439_c1_g1_i1:77-1540(-)
MAASGGSQLPAEHSRSTLSGNTNASGTKKKPTLEQQLVTELSQDKRLRGHEEAVYYTLRGYGLPVIQGDEYPRIEVSAVRQPTLFHALKRLGLRPEGKRMIVEPRPDARASPLSPARSFRKPLGSPMASTLRSNELFESSFSFGCSDYVSSKQARTLGKPFIGGAGRRHPMPSHKEHEAFFERMQRPRHAQTSHVLRGSLNHVETEVWPPPARSLGSSREGSDTGLAHSRSASNVISPSGSHMRIIPPENDGVGDSWKMSNKQPNAREQRQHCEKLSRPRKTVSVPSLFSRSQQGMPQTIPLHVAKAARAADRSLRQRLAEVDAMGGYPWVVAVWGRADASADASAAESEAGSLEDMMQREDDTDVPSDAGAFVERPTSPTPPIEMEDVEEEEERQQSLPAPAFDASSASEVQTYSVADSPRDAQDTEVEDARDMEHSMDLLAAVTAADALELVEVLVRPAPSESLAQRTATEVFEPPLAEEILDPE